MEQDIKRMKELIDILNEASIAYYQNSVTIMTDYEYDKLYDELVDLEAKTGMVLSNSPTNRVEPEIQSSLETVEHPSPMLSLGKTKSVDDLVDFIKEKSGLLSWKLDGLTIVLTYENGKLASGVTRGNGIIGEVVTENVKQFKNIPLTIPYKEHLVLRGEAIIKYSDFNKMNNELEDSSQYKNPRNLCSGSVRQLDSKITKKRNVNIVIFALIECNKEFKYKSEQYEWLKSLGFEVVEYYKVDSSSIPSRVEYFKDRVANYDIPSDGLVLTFDDIAYGNSLGSTAKAPRHSIAFKWKDETVLTTLRSIDWMVSRTGLINPVAVFDPVDLEGTIVSRASLHNISILQGLEIGIGDIVEVYKANMIILQIAENETRSNNLVIPNICPVCGHNAEIISTNDVKYLYCMNDFCSAKLMKRLSLFVSRNAMDIDGISDQILSKLIDENLVNNYGDLYRLEDKKDIIINFDGFGEKSYNNMIKSINKSRKIKLANFIYALGIPEIGFSRAKLICSKFNNDINILRNLKVEDLSNIDGIGDIIAIKWVETFKNEDFIKDLDDVLQYIEFSDVKNTNNQVLKDLTFVITGSLEHYENRDVLVEYIESLGGKTSSSVSTKTNYLINNDITSTSGKNKKAKELNIPIITEEDFIRLSKGEL